MNYLLKFLAVGILAALTSTLGGCAPTLENRHPVLISDVSISGITSASRLDAVASEKAQGIVKALQPGDVLTVYAFSATLTSACTPITASFAQQNNSEAQDRLKEDLVNAVPSAYETYVKCVRDESAGGSSAPGSPIFGAIVEATSRAKPSGPITSIELVTDGCSFGEGELSCSPTMTDPGFATRFVQQLPTALKPDLSGVQLSVTGLGQGTGMSSEQITVLREIFTTYGTATGSTVQFN